MGVGVGVYECGCRCARRVCMYMAPLGVLVCVCVCVCVCVHELNNGFQFTGCNIYGIAFLLHSGCHILKVIYPASETCIKQQLIYL